MAHDTSFEPPAALTEATPRRRSFGTLFLSMLGRSPSASAPSKATSSPGPTPVAQAGLSAPLAPVGVAPPSLMVLLQPLSETPQEESPEPVPLRDTLMSNSPTMANILGPLELLDLHGLQPTVNEEIEHPETPRTATPEAVGTVPVVDDAGTVAMTVSEGIVREETSNTPDEDGNYSIRLTAFVDFSASQPGLYFPPVIRKIKEGGKLALGRYTEKNRAAAHAPQGSSEAVVFKSKVVSRTHAVFYTDSAGVWYVKDLGSSSGTFLNHVRLSPASAVSAGTKLKDGDVLQLGMDYRGGSEEVFRCIKMRVELNHSWQRKANAFNLEAHNKLKQLAGAPGGLAEPNECAICLLDVEPCQAVFISPCSHLWHYKCIRPILLKCYPQFFCPNCRSMCDLETDGDDV